MPTPIFNRYLRYDELTPLLHAYAAEYPALVQIESLGKILTQRAAQWGQTRLSPPLSGGYLRTASARSIGGSAPRKTSETRRTATWSGMVPRP